MIFVGEEGEVEEDRIVGYWIWQLKAKQKRGVARRTSEGSRSCDERGRG